MKTIKLYGHLGKKFGKIHKFNVKTPAEAIRALKANLPEFTSYVIKHNLPGYKVLVGSENRSDPEMLHFPADNEIKIIPMIQGSGGQWGMVIIGVVLIAASIVTAGAASVAAAGVIEAGVAAGTIEAVGAGLATASTIMNVAGAVSTALMTVGTALTLSGVSSLLFSPSTPTAIQNSSQDQISSSHFNGPINLAQQGNPIPLAYGRVRVGSQVISAGITTNKA